MNLKTLLLSLSKDERHQLAVAVHSSVGHLLNVMNGYRPCSPLLASRLERETRQRYGEHQMVRRLDLIPDTGREIWPELANTNGGDR